MTAPIRQQLTREVLDALADADDATFWEILARHGYHRPEAIDPDQAWFWTRQWVTGELEADLNYAEGRFTRYDSSEEFLASLRERALALDADERRG